jgi:hypothetical protein
MRYLHPNLEAKVQAVGKLAASCDNSGPLEIECGPAFTVICGRNGTGKSSICDSLEFVLTGTLERYQEESERGEKISDYLWWRGKPAVPITPSWWNLKKKMDRCSSSGASRIPMQRRRKSIALLTGKVLFRMFSKNLV